MARLWSRKWLYLPLSPSFKGEVDKTSSHKLESSDEVYDGSEAQTLDSPIARQLDSLTGQ